MTGSSYSATLDMEELVKMIKFNEGLSLVSYLDRENHMTIGYGRKLEPGTYLTISDETAELWLQEDITTAIRKLDKYYPWWVELHSGTRLVMVDMVHNMGFTGFSKFTWMIKALHADAYPEAAIELLDSEYAVQLPNRANRNFDLISRGF